MRMNRRSFLATSTMAALAAACGQTTDTNGVVVGQEQQLLKMLNWADYVDPTEDGAVGTVERFRNATGISVDYRPDYDGNFEALEALLAPTLGQGAPTGEDIIVPTYWLAQRMLEDGWLERIPLELVPNHVNIDPAFTGLSWDRGARSHMPWQVGITGIAYNPALTGEIRSIEQLFDRELRGRVSFIGEMREAVGLVMLGQGSDPSRATVDAARAALDRIESVAADVQFTFEEFSDKLATGEVAAAMAWSGDIVQLQAERPDIKFVVPVEGAIRWFDTMIIPRGATHPGNAARFMDFVYSPEQAAQITAWVQYISPVLGVRDELVRQGNGALAEDPILFPDDETSQRLITWGGMSRADEDAIDADFAEIARL